MFGEAIAATGRARLVGALALACLVLGLLLGLSIWGNVAQWRSKAAAVSALVAQLAAAEARGAAEIQACAATNQRVAGTVGVLEAELAQCRGQEQNIQESLALSLRQRERARNEITALEQQRRAIVEQLVNDHESDCNRPICRALSDRVLGLTPSGGAE